VTTALITHQSCFDHVTPEGHPERVARLKSVLEGLGGAEFDGLLREESPAVEMDIVGRVHTAAHIDHILASDQQSERRKVDPDTFMSIGSSKAALHAAGAVVRAVDLVSVGSARNGFCAVRPPGHHAEPDAAMGFCLFNNVAIGAMRARDKWGHTRIAVVDFDVHHGNGTQAAFFDDENAFYGSTHQSPLYPGTGLEPFTGISGNIVNAVLEPGAGSTEFREAYEDCILPGLLEFQPDFLLISAGFDGHVADPLAGLNLSDDDFVWLTRRLMDVANSACSGRLVSVLEGGYDLVALRSASAAHVRALME
jgi:acetoin utilization deacetylase AcuC-like enzyme